MWWGGWLAGEFFEPDRWLLGDHSEANARLRPRLPRLQTVWRTSPRRTPMRVSRQTHASMPRIASSRTLGSISTLAANALPTAPLSPDQPPAAGGYPATRGRRHTGRSRADLRCKPSDDIEVAAAPFRARKRGRRIKAQTLATVNTGRTWLSVMSANPVEAAANLAVR